MDFSDSVLGGDHRPEYFLLLQDPEPQKKI
jgi:hypothetical protein